MLYFHAFEYLEKSSLNDYNLMQNKRKFAFTPNPHTIILLIAEL